MKFKKNAISTTLLFIFSSIGICSVPYPIIDTGQMAFYNNSTEIAEPASDESFYGQDAQYSGIEPNYTLSGDGLTVYDENTGLTWTQTPDIDGDDDIDVYDKLTFAEAQNYPATLNAANFGGFNDWRLPSIKELYSLMLFSGTDPSGYEGTDTSGLIPFIDTDYFDFGFGDTNANERLIDAQFCSSNQYVGLVMGGQPGVFGLNLADGRIKGYPSTGKTFYVYFVCGNTEYGVNEFIDNGDNTISDAATGLMWQKYDSGSGMLWQDALSYAENLTEAGYDDWRLPNAKELQSILDYTRSPSTSSSAAIDPNFHCTLITDEGGDDNYAFYWTGTTHMKYNGIADNAVYVCFGEALGWMQQPPSFNYTLLDVHGAGSQRSDPKTGDPDDYPYGHGPQGDVIRIYNYVRCVKDIQCGEGGYTYPPGDLSEDCFVNMADFARLAEGWQSSYDIIDLEELAVNWLE